MLSLRHRVYHHLRILNQVLLHHLQLPKNKFLRRLLVFLLIPATVQVHLLDKQSLLQREKELLLKAVPDGVKCMKLLSVCSLNIIASSFFGFIYGSCFEKHLRCHSIQDMISQLQNTLSGSRAGIVNIIKHIAKLLLDFF